MTMLTLGFNVVCILMFFQKCFFEGWQPNWFDFSEGNRNGIWGGNFAIFFVGVMSGGEGGIFFFEIFLGVVA